ncbi:iron-sulfur cluster co-chaperone protein HscB isoform X2 [Perognathus longimembris pacificus]|uniref:iron-sulfur cluster co-chaperone protein HscB isoform X2 n=1 Tax=Perognathus longimembris pacificus TaxID=214514 RepID=UPI002019DFE7|nr:iron-sulfur cluster co-chaperone protein HscB isoform X2 [Perognathus longimembris pacificus]
MWVWKAGALLRLWGLQAAGVPRRLLSSNAASQAGTNWARCWHCGDPGRGDGFFCPRCRALQPPDPTRDYFSLMDCNRSFKVDTTKLQQRYQQLQRLIHPDFFSQRSQIEKDFSEKHSTLVNDAYKTLLAPLSRGLYLLKLHGIEIPEGTDCEIDSQFLMEIMEINEKLAEAQSEDAVAEVESTVQDDFEKAKEILTKMKYFSNIEEKVKLKKIPL